VAFVVFMSQNSSWALNEGVDLEQELLMVVWMSEDGSGGKAHLKLVEGLSTRVIPNILHILFKEFVEWIGDDAEILYEASIVSV
jgi:hypothetical protein